jgi:hypothetical protein
MEMAMARRVFFAPILLTAVLAAPLWLPSPAHAQSNLQAGKSAGEIFASTCSVCHKSPRGLVRAVPPGSLAGFLRQHYTTSTEMAGMLAGYVTVGRPGDPANPTRLPDAKPDAAGEGAAARGKRKPKPDAAPEGAAGQPAAIAAVPAGDDAKPRPADSAKSKAAKKKGAKREPEPAPAPPPESVVAAPAPPPEPPPPPLSVSLPPPPPPKPTEAPPVVAGLPRPPGVMPSVPSSSVTPTTLPAATPGAPPLPPLPQ